MHSLWLTEDCHHFFPTLFFPCKLLTRALAGHCAKLYHVLQRRQAAPRGRQESIAPAALLTLPPLSLTSYLSHWKGAWAGARQPWAAVGGWESETDSTAWMPHAGAVSRSCAELQHELPSLLWTSQTEHWDGRENNTLLMTHETRL